MTTPDDHLVVLFGATGDLAKRKLLPGLFRLAQAGLLPPRYRIVGTALDDLDDHAFRRARPHCGRRVRRGQPVTLAPGSVSPATSSTPMRATAPP